MIFPSFTVSAGATWDMYFEYDCYNRIPMIYANDSINYAYIKVTAADGVTHQIYTLIIYKGGYIEGPSSMDYKGSTTVYATAPVVDWWTTSMKASIYPSSDGMSAAVVSERQFWKMGSIEVYARTAAGDTFYHRIDVKPTFLQWLIIIFLFGWIWY